MGFLVSGARASGLTATAAGQRKRTGEQVSGNGEAAEKLELALAEPGGLRAFAFDLHTLVIRPAGYAQSSPISGMRKSKGLRGIQVGGCEDAGLQILTGFAHLLFPKRLKPRC